MSWSLEHVIARLVKFNSYNIHVHCSALTLTLESQNCIKIQCTYQNYVKHDLYGLFMEYKKKIRKF